MAYVILEIRTADNKSLQEYITCKAYVITNKYRQIRCDEKCKS